MLIVKRADTFGVWATSVAPSCKLNGVLRATAEKLNPVASATTLTTDNAAHVNVGRRNRNRILVRDSDVHGWATLDEGD